MTDIGIDGTKDVETAVNAGSPQTDMLRSARFRMERETHWRRDRKSVV